MNIIEQKPFRACAQAFLPWGGKDAHIANGAKPIHPSDANVMQLHFRLLLLVAPFLLREEIGNRKKGPGKRGFPRYRVLRIERMLCSQCDYWRKLAPSYLKDEARIKARMIAVKGACRGPMLGV